MFGDHDGFKRIVGSGPSACGRLILVFLVLVLSTVWAVADTVDFVEGHYSYAGTLDTFLQKTQAHGIESIIKMGGVIVTAGSSGVIDTVKDLYFYFTFRRMIPANWVAAYPGGKDELRKKEKCMKAAWELGRKMACLTKKKFEFPSEFERSHFTYGTHTN